MATWIPSMRTTSLLALVALFVGVGLLLTGILPLQVVGGTMVMVAVGAPALRGMAVAPASGRTPSVLPPVVVSVPAVVEAERAAVRAELERFYVAERIRSTQALLRGQILASRWGRSVSLDAVTDEDVMEEIHRLGVVIPPDAYATYSQVVAATLDFRTPSPEMLAEQTRLSLSDLNNIIDNLYKALTLVPRRNA